MALSDSFFGQKFGIDEHDLQGYVSEALSAGGRYADLYFEYITTSNISIDESIVKSAVQGVFLGVGVRVLSGERTGYAYSDDLSPFQRLDAGGSIAEVARAFEVNPNLLHRWRQEFVKVRETPFGSAVGTRSYDP